MLERGGEAAHECRLVLEREGKAAQECMWVLERGDAASMNLHIYLSLASVYSIGS